MKKILGQKIHSMGVELWQNLFVVIDRGPAGFGVAYLPTGRRICILGEWMLGRTLYSFVAITKQWMHDNP